jgi:hypothetical protein
MWGMSLQFWELVFRWATVSAGLLGVLTAAAAFISAWVGYQLTDVVQKDADRRIEEARVANKVLEAKIQPRRISGETSTQMSAILSMFHGVQIVVVSSFFDAEAKDFGDDLEIVFRNAGWTTARTRNGTWALPLPGKGVFIATMGETLLPPPIEKAIVDALAANGMECKPIRIDEKTKDTISPSFEPKLLYLLVGARP